MKVTNFGDQGMPIAAGISYYGVTSISSNATTGEGGPNNPNFVQLITSNTSNQLQNPIVNFAAGSGISLAASSNTITITGSGGATTAAAVSIVDAGAFYTAVEVESALQELAKKDLGYTAHGNTGSTETFDALTGWHSATLNANCTFTFTGATSGLVAAMALELLQDGTGSRLVTWPGSVVWAGGAAPTLSTAAGSVDVLTFFSRDGGTTWYGFPTGGSGGGGGTTITTKDEGSTLSSSVTTLDFVGAGVTASGAGATTTVTIAGGSGLSLPTFVQTKTSFGGGSNTALTLTMDAAPTNGNVLILGSFSNGNADLTSVTQTNVTWTKVASGTAITNTKLNIWVGKASASAGTLITIVRGGGGANAVWLVCEYSGLTVTPTGGTPVTSTDLKTPVVLPTTTSGHLIAFAGGSVSQNQNTWILPGVPVSGIQAGWCAVAVGYSLGAAIPYSGSNVDGAGGSIMVVEIT